MDPYLPWLASSVWIGGQGARVGRGIDTRSILSKMRRDRVDILAAQARRASGAFLVQYMFVNEPEVLDALVREQLAGTLTEKVLHFLEISKASFKPRG